MSMVLRLGLVWALVCLSYQPVAAADAVTYAVPGVYSVQVDTCSRRASAEVVVANLHARGYLKAYVFQHTSLKQRTTWYVVRLGDFGTLAAARQAAEAYGGDMGKTALITPVDSLKSVRVVAPPEPAPRVAVKKAPPATQEPIPAPKATKRERPKGERPKKTRTEISPVAAEAIHAAGAVAATPSYTLLAMQRLSETADAAASAASAAGSPTTPAAAQGESQPENPAETQEGVEPPIKVPEAASPTAVPMAASSANDERLQKLRDQVDQLQEEVKVLRDQAEIRKKLELTESEKSRQEKEILSAAGRQYTLLSRNAFGIEYNLTYTYYSTDTIRDYEETTSIAVEQRDNHTLKNSLLLEYALLSNITLNVNAPFVYKYDRTGRDDEMEVTDIGDVSGGFQYQPLSSKGGRPAFILFGSYTFPWGRSPYEINPDTELATGQGYPSAQGGFSLSKTIDPIMAYGSAGYSYNFPVDNLHQIRRVGDEMKTLEEVEPGDRVDGSLGFGLALSYNVSLNASFQYSYYFGSEYTWDDGTTSKSANTTGATVSIGTGWRLSPGTIVNLKVGMGLTQNDPDFTFSLRIPFEFNKGQ
jgi:hypothetical protein